MTFCLTKSYLVISLALFLSFLPFFFHILTCISDSIERCLQMLCGVRNAAQSCFAVDWSLQDPNHLPDPVTPLLSLLLTVPVLKYPRHILSCFPRGSATGQGISSLFGLLCLLMCRHVVMGQHLLLFMYAGVGCIFSLFRINQPAVRNWICVYLYALSECVLFIGTWAKLPITHHKLIIYNEQLSIISLILLLWNIRLFQAGIYLPVCYQPGSEHCWCVFRVTL